MSSPRILVTGGTGYIGSHTVVELISAGYEVLILDNLSNSREEVLSSLENITEKKIPFFNIDLCDKNATEEFVKKIHPDAVIHFAAFKSVNESVLEPMKYYRNNLLSLINLTEACISHSVWPMVFSSSCSVYGEPDSLPVNENSVLKKAESPYGYTKQICEKILEDLCRATQLKTICLRYFNPVGAHNSALIGEYPLLPPNNLVPVITQTAIGLRKEMEVYGSDYDTPDGSTIRDYIHVVDIARAHVSALGRLLGNKTKSSFEIFNLGTGKGNSVLEVIRAFEKVSGQKLNYRLSPRRSGDVVKIYADCGLANKELDWKAELDLEAMVLSAWNWEKNLSKVKI